jgi:phosphatidylglycerol lysyltransferase
VNYPVSRFKRPNLLAGDWAEKNSEDFIEASLAVAAHPDRLVRTLLISLFCYIVDIASLYFVFLAFAQPVSFGVLVAGFSMGILFWIVSITPQGIGIVEGMMTLVFTSLGVPAERAAVIAIAFRGLTFWLPLFLGFILLRRIRTFAGESHHWNKADGIHALALLTAAMGVVNIVSAITPSLKDRLALLEQYSPFGVSTGGHLTVALGGFALLLLATGLWRRKRTSWVLTLVILIVSIPAHLIKGLDYEEAILAALLAIWLFALRSHFHTRSDAPSVRQGLLAVPVAFTFTLMYGIAGFYLLDHHFKVNFGFWAAVRQTIVMFTEYYNPGIEPITGFGRYFADSIYTFSAAAGFYALLMLIRPVLMRERGVPAEREKARAIVEAHGHSSLARLTLLEDKLYFFSPGGSVISYVVQGRIALALGDPIGPMEDAEDVVSAFKKFCSANDWQPVFYQVLEELLDVYKTAGFDSLCIGHEGIVDLTSFTLAGGENKNMRTAVNRMNKLGYHADVVMPSHPAALLSELQEISDEWLTEMHGSEKRFSLGWFDEAYLNDCPIVLIRNPRGEVDAFANILREYQANEVSIDLMRHRLSAERGQMDYLFVSLFEWARRQGYASFNFGLSALSGIGEKTDDPAVERALHYIYEHVNQFYNFKGLHEFKDKYHPAWSPRYLIFPGAVNLPAAAIAIFRADSGGNLFG